MTAPDFSLTGRTALVTGGGRGLGRAVAEGMAAAGAHVVLTARSVDQLTQVQQAVTDSGGRCSVLPADLSDPATASGLVDAAAELAGGVDVLVHAAGNQVRKPALEVSGDDWDAIQQVHLRSAFVLAQATARALVARGAPGSVLFIASLNSFRGLPGVSPYVAAKTGVLGLTRVLAVEWAQHGIRVNAIAPGFFPTEMTHDAEGDPARQAIVARTPMGRQGRPEELAGAAVFLASPAAGYVTGQCLTVDGGWTAA